MRNFLAILAHRFWVTWYIFKTCLVLLKRAWKHDFSKFGKHERRHFQKYTSLLRNLTYGSDEYKRIMALMQPAIDHHYAENRHHPEFYGGFSGMSPVDLIEMLCDWRAAVRRHKNGDLRQSIEINAKRFGYGETVKQALVRDALEIGILKKERKCDD